MIELESFERTRKIDLHLILIFASIWSIINIFIDYIAQEYLYHYSVISMIFFMTLTLFFVRRFGSATLFLTFGSIISSLFINFYSLGWKIIIVFATSGLIFELFVILIKIEIAYTPLGVIIAAGISAGSIPWIIYSTILFKNPVLTSSVWNLSLLSFFIGTLTSTIAYLIWYHIKDYKKVIKFEYHI